MTLWPNHLIFIEQMHLTLLLPFSLPAIQPYSGVHFCNYNDNDIDENATSNFINFDYMCILVSMYVILVHNANGTHLFLVRWFWTSKSIKHSLYHFERLLAKSFIDFTQIQMLKFNSYSKMMERKSVALCHVLVFAFMVATLFFYISLSISPSFYLWLWGECGGITSTVHLSGRNFPQI